MGYRSNTRRVERWLAKRGYSDEDPAGDVEGEPSEMLAASVAGRAAHGLKATSLHFSPRGERKRVRGLSARGARRSARTGVLDGTSSEARPGRNATVDKRNDGMTGLSRACAVRR